MSLESRISDAVLDWCGRPATDFTVTLEDLWISASSMPFDQDGMDLLEARRILKFSFESLDSACLSDAAGSGVEWTEWK